VPSVLAVAGVLVVLAYAGELLGILTANRAWLAERLPDDAFYYLQVARNIGGGQEPTFDGIHLTNGFHTLWEFLLVPLQEGVRYLVARREMAPDDAPACASLIWTSPQAVTYTSVPDGGVSRIPLRVWTSRDAADS
jgi:hypothetical protein